jgi:DNA polymerase-3 subunit gamma/tau
MAYQALARKWRPRNFKEVVGQEHVVKALTHALEFDRTHHAYLFTGTRGVGKTTLARILAKAMNCDARSGANPCGQCLICREVDEGRFVDLIEVDAASRTKVEDTRELLENVQYAPSQGRFKVYLIDEVHMLSGHSFNALLKTLEEPPPHVKFLLATTDPQKIPVTVLSRCLQFNLKRLSAEQIRGQMERILREESIAFDSNALRSLARAADGSMRDGLSLLDQAIAHGGGRLAEEPVSAMLGTVARTPLFDLLWALAESDAAKLLEISADMAAHASSFSDALQQMLIILHHAALAQWVPEAVRHDDDADALLALAQHIPADDLQLYYQIALLGQRDLPLAPDPRAGFEMVLLRMLAFRPVAASTEAGGESKAPVRAVPAQHPKPRNAVAPRPASVATAPAPPPRTSVDSGDWPQMIQAMGLSGLTQQLAQNCTLVTVDESRVVLALDPQFGSVRTVQLESKLEKALQQHFGRPVKLNFSADMPQQETPAALIQRARDERQRQAEQEIEQDENIRALKERFDARVLPGSIKPLD